MDSAVHNFTKATKAFQQKLDTDASLLSRYKEYFIFPWTVIIDTEFILTNQLWWPMNNIYKKAF